MSSDIGPSLANRLVAAWKAETADPFPTGRLSTEATWAARTIQEAIVGVGASQGPSLAFGDQLYASWKGIVTTQGSTVRVFDGDTLQPTS